MVELKFMIVDDSVILSNLLRKELESLGHKVVQECTIATFAAMEYEAYKPDIVTMDINMPEKDGISVVKEILKLDPNAIILMVTSQGHKELVLASIKAGAKGYILKPFQKDTLDESIKKIYFKYMI